LSGRSRAAGRARALDEIGAARAQYCFPRKEMTMRSRPTSPGVNHKELVREEFTRQADDYARAPWISDPDRVADLVRVLNPPPEARVLEVATGPGHVAMGLAKAVREVVAVDLTEAPLAIAERMRRARGLENVRFQLADAERLPFRGREFDAVVCRFALHHFPNPRVVLAEMARVCRPGGKIAIEDIIASEHPARARYHNRFERLRDPSHTRALALSALVRMVAGAGFELVRFESSAIRSPVERWLENAHTPLKRAAKVRAMIERDLAEDLSGTRPARLGGELHFTQRIAIIVGRKLGR
jgi:ubiquinone/menaquinone biosynthesis C-methylase UbiE